MNKNSTLKAIFASVLMLCCMTVNAQDNAPLLSQLNIVGKAEVSLTQEVRNNTMGDYVYIDIKDAIAPLGYDEAYLAENITSLLYVTKFDVDNERVLDVMTNKPTFTEPEPGWWFTTLYEGDDETTSVNCAALPDEDSGTLEFYAAWPSYSEGTLSMMVGQAPYNLSAGYTYSAKLYLLKDNDAVEITINLKATEGATSFNLAEMEKAGDMNFDLQINYNTSFRYKTIELNEDSLKAGLVVLIDGPSLWGDDTPLTLWGLKDAATLTNHSTANYGGYWFNNNGFVQEWGENCAMFVEPEMLGSVAKLHVGVYPDYMAINTTKKATLFLIGNTNSYVQLNITIKINPQPQVPQCETVKTLDLTMEIVPTTAEREVTECVQPDYMKGAFDLSDLVELLEEGEYTFYAEAMNPITGDILQYTNARSSLIDSPNGFLMMDLAYFENPAMAHTAAPFNPLPELTKCYGIGYDNLKLSFWEWPGDRNVGDYYQNRFYLVNHESGKKVILNLTVVFVKERCPDFEIIGETDIALPAANSEGADFAATVFDIDDILGQLECSNAESLTWRAYNQLGQLISGEALDEMYGFGFDKEGKTTTEEADQVFFTGYCGGEFHSFVKDANLRENDFTTVLIAEYNGKAYKFNITLTNKIEDSIFGLDADKQIGKGNAIYDLTGRKVTSASKGIYIQNGKKILVK